MQIETLGDALTHSVKIHMRCAYGNREGLKTIRECQFKTVLDNLTLVCTRGRDMPIMLLQERLRCPRCGSRRIRLFLAIPDQPQTQALRIANPRGNYELG